MQILKKIKVINIGAEFFWKEMEKQGIDSIMVRWTPPNDERIEALEMIKKLRVGKRD